MSAGLRISGHKPRYRDQRAETNYQTEHLSGGQVLPCKYTQQVRMHRRRRAEPSRAEHFDL
jgi:hypothetical protein